MTGQASDEEKTVAALLAKTVDETEWPTISPGATLRPRDEGAKPAVALPAQTSADYEVLSELGRGGMGVVFRARQVALRREVAIKKPLNGPGTDGVSQRFLGEALVTGWLDHPNIVPVHELGRLPDGDCFLAMKLVGGMSWRDFLHPSTDAHRARAATFDRERHMETLIAVANAVSFAHSRGIVHRDLKPENVMIGEFGEVLVMDWGIAVSFDASRGPGDIIPHRSASVAPAGTPAYMAPELAEGRGEAMGPATDVYLLGGILHEVLTGRPPHTGRSLVSTLLAAIKSEPPAFEKTVPGELQAICRKALAREPSARHASVAELQADLRGWLVHRQAHDLCAKGEALVAKLRGAQLPAPGVERERTLEELHRLHAEARFAFAHAREIWPDAKDALAGAAAASGALLDVAVATEDLALARRLLADLGDDPAARAKVETLARTLDERARELERLRDAARRHDWSTVARPLGTLFIAGGVLGGAAGFASALAIEGSTGPEAVNVIRNSWLAVIVVVGGLGYALLRGTKLPNTLVSGRVLGSWAMIALGCMLVGALNHLRGRTPLSDSCYSALLIAVGFATMAFQTRPWVFIPAVVFTATALVMGAWPGPSMYVFAAAWAVTMSGFGLALRGGATLGEGG